MSIRIVKFKKGDERKVANLCKKCITEIDRKSLTKKQAEYLIHEFSPKGIVRLSKLATVYVAKKTDKIIGTATLFNNQVKGVFVNPSYQNQGVGTKMIEHVENIAEKSGHNFTFLNAGNFAVKFCKKLGYKKIKLVDSLTGKLTLMKKKLLP
jgi:citrate lyase synthetase